MAARTERESTFTTVVSSLSTCPIFESQVDNKLSTFELEVESSESSSELRLKPTMRPEASPQVSQQRAATSTRSPNAPLSPPMGYNTWK